VLEIPLSRLEISRLTVVRYRTSGKEREEVVLDVNELQTIEVHRGGGSKRHVWGEGGGMRCAAEEKERSAREREGRRGEVLYFGFDN
jgi:hypothetical protein